MARVITAYLARKALNEAVEVHGPDHVAPAEYVESGGNDPGCLVGTALFHLGVPVSALREMDDQVVGAEGSEIDGGHCLDVLAKHGFRLTDVAARVFKAAQDAQDAGDEWGEVLINLPSDE